MRCRRCSATGCSSATAICGGSAAASSRRSCTPRACHCSRRPWSRRPARPPRAGRNCRRARRSTRLREMATLTAEIICRTIFGPRLGAEHAGEIVASFSAYQRQVGAARPAVPAGSAGLAAALPVAGGAPRGKAHRPGARRHHPALRRAAAGGEQSMIRMLLEARDPETGDGARPRSAAQRGRGHLHGRRMRPPPTRSPGPGICCRRRRRSRRACMPNSTRCWAAGCRPRRRAAARLHPRGVRGGDPALSAGAVARAARRCAKSGSATAESRPARCWS